LHLKRDILTPQISWCYNMPARRRGEANFTAAGVGREALKLMNCASFCQATGQI
jgi:hypothetical protein